MLELFNLKLEYRLRFHYKLQGSQTRGNQINMENLKTHLDVYCVDISRLNVSSTGLVLKMYLTCLGIFVIEHEMEVSP